MKKIICIVLSIIFLTFLSFSEGKKEINPDSIMAVQLSDTLRLADYSVYGAFPEKDCLAVGKKTESNGIQLQTLCKLNIVSNEITEIFNPLEIGFSDLEEVSSISIQGIWFINENEIYLSIDCRYLQNDKINEFFSVIYNQQTHVLRVLSYDQREISFNFRNDANRHIVVEKNDSVYAVYFGDSLRKEEIDISTAFSSIPVVYPGFVDSEVIAVFDKQSSVELVSWNYINNEITNIIFIPDHEYSIPFFSPDQKYVAMFSYKYGLLLMDLNTGDSAHIIATYETRPQYWPLYTSIFWSWDSNTIYLQSNSKWFSIMINTIFLT